MSAIGLALVTSGCAAATSAAKGALGVDTAGKPVACAVIEPSLLPAAELDQAVADLVATVAAQHGSLIGFIVDGPSAASFRRFAFDDDAHLGRFDSPAANEQARRRDVRRWSASATSELRAQVDRAANKPTTSDSTARPNAAQRPGADLLGGIGQCSRALPSTGRPGTVVLVTAGVHRTVDLDLAAEPARVGELTELTASQLGTKHRLALVLIGRVDSNAIDGPPARDVIEPMVAGWHDACAALADRCVFGALDAATWAARP